MAGERVLSTGYSLSGKKYEGIHHFYYLQVGLLRVSEYSDTRGSEYKIEYEYSSLPKSLDRDLFFFFFFFFFLLFFN